MKDGPIVLVEDNLDDALLTMRALVKSGADNEVVLLSDGERGIAALLPQSGRRAATPAMVLLDVELPKVSGLEVLRRIRADERTRTIPVIMLSTSQEHRDILESYRLGANSFVRKPFSFARFQAIVRTLVEYWLDINEPCRPPGQR